MLPAFDTLEYAHRLREAGFTEQQAEGQARALATAMTDSIATKQDLHALEVRIDELEKRIEARLDARLADLERRLTLRLGGMMFAGIAVVSALVKVL